MLKKKPVSGEKKRKHTQSEEGRDKDERRSKEPNVRLDSKDELADPELDRVSSDIEEGGLDLNLPFRPITSFVVEKREMLEQCFRVLGEKKLHKMLPDELKEIGLEEIKKLCWEQLEPISERNLIQILAGEEVTFENSSETLESQQDNNVDSTSCLKETVKSEDAKQEGGGGGGGSGEESDVLSINADTNDSDIEGPKEEQTDKAVDRPVKLEDGSGSVADPSLTPDPAQSEPPADSPPAEVKKDIQSDIDKSVSEILALSSSSSKEVAIEESTPPPSAEVTPPVQASTCAPAAGQPSIQQLALLELEMRARAIKALMKAGDLKTAPVAKNM